MARLKEEHRQKLGGQLRDFVVVRSSTLLK